MTPSIAVLISGPKSETDTRGLDAAGESRSLLGPASAAEPSRTDIARGVPRTVVLLDGVRFDIPSVIGATLGDGPAWLCNDTWCSDGPSAGEADGKSEVAG